MPFIEARVRTGVRGPGSARGGCRGLLPGCWRAEAATHPDTLAESATNFAIAKDHDIFINMAKTLAQEEIRGCGPL